MRVPSKQHVSLIYQVKQTAQRYVLSSHFSHALSAALDGGMQPLTLLQLLAF